METKTNSAREMSPSDPANSRISQGKINPTKLLITLMIILLTAGSVGGGTYYVLNQNFKQERVANEKALNDAADRISKLEKTEESTTTTTTNSTPSTNSTPTATPIDTRKTYTNTECKFTFKYPNEYSINNEMAKNVFISIDHFVANNKSFDVSCTHGDEALVRNREKITFGTNSFYFVSTSNQTTYSYAVGGTSPASYLINFNDNSRVNPDISDILKSFQIQ